MKGLRGFRPFFVLERFFLAFLSHTGIFLVYFCWPSMIYFRTPQFLSFGLSGVNLTASKVPEALLTPPGRKVEWRVGFHHYGYCAHDIYFKILIRGARRTPKT